MTTKTIMEKIIEYEEKQRVGISKYAIVDSKNNIVEKFRTINTARSFLIEIKNDYYEELKIVKLK